MKLTVVVLLVCLAGLALGSPAQRFQSRSPASLSATELDSEQLRQTVTLIEQFIPPLLSAMTDENDNPVNRMNKLVDTALVLREESIKLSGREAGNKEVLAEIAAARETMPLIMDILRATMAVFQPKDAYNPAGAVDPSFPDAASYAVRQ